MRIILVLAAWVVVFVVTVTVKAQTDTTFTYQGALMDNGQPANGVFVLDFSLQDALSAGTQVGTTLNFPGVPVNDGRFTVQLDFGAAAFDSADRWLQITVNGFLLTPRQPITRAPYAIQTRGIFVDGTDRVGIGTSAPASDVHIAGDNATLRLQDDDDPNSHTSLIDVWKGGTHLKKTVDTGTALLDFDASPQDGSSDAWIRFFRDTNTSGSKQVRFHQGDGTTAPSANIGVGGASSWFQIDGGNFGIGTTSPRNTLHVVGKEAIFGETNNGIYAISGLNNDPNGVVGVYGTATAQNGSGVRGFAASTTGQNYGVHGQSMSPSGYDFYADGAGQDYGSSSSKRWKRNIENINHPLEKIACLRGVYFDWDTEHGGHRDVGMIAEEVGVVLPEIVQYEENGVDAIGMDYSKLTPLLVEGINALRLECDGELESLRAENANLRARLAKLERVIERSMALPNKEITQ